MRCAISIPHRWWCHHSLPFSRDTSFSLACPPHLTAWRMIHVISIHSSIIAFITTYQYVHVPIVVSVSPTCSQFRSNDPRPVDCCIANKQCEKLLASLPLSSLSSSSLFHYRHCCMVLIISSDARQWHGRSVACEAPWAIITYNSGKKTLCLSPQEKENKNFPVGQRQVAQIDEWSVPPPPPC
jgi:hypothetical protein